MCVCVLWNKRTMEQTVWSKYGRSPKVTERSSNVIYSKKPSSPTQPTKSSSSPTHILSNILYFFFIVLITSGNYYILIYMFICLMLPHFRISWLVLGLAHKKHSININWISGQTVSIHFCFSSVQLLTHLPPLSVYCLGPSLTYRLFQTISFYLVPPPQPSLYPSQK